MKSKITTKNKILLASYGIFREYGYRRASMTKIAEKAGVTLSLLHYYFPKKQDFVIEIMGNFLNTIHYFALLYSNNNPLIAYIATNYVYHDRLLNDPRNIKFYNDVFNRTDKKDLSSYLNFNKVHLSLIEFLNINITYEELKYRDVYIYGVKKEFINVYLNKTIDIDFDLLVESITENTCYLLDISDYIIQDAKLKSKKVVKKLNVINFQIWTD